MFLNIFIQMIKIIVDYNYIINNIINSIFELYRFFTLLLFQMSTTYYSRAH